MFLKKARAVFDATVDFFFWTAGIILIIAVLSVCTEVFMRYFLNRPQIWVVEGVENMLLFITFMATTWLLRQEKHVKIDVVLTLLGPRNQLLVSGATSVICAIACLLIAWYGTQVVWGNFLRGAYFNTALKLPVTPLLSVIVIGFFLLSIEFLRRAYTRWKGWRMSGQR